MNIVISPTISITNPIIKNVNPASVPGLCRILLSPSSIKVSSTPKNKNINYMYVQSSIFFEWIALSNPKFFQKNTDLYKLHKILGKHVLPQLNTNHNFDTNHRSCQHILLFHLHHIDCQSNLGRLRIKGLLVKFSIH